MIKFFFRQWNNKYFNFLIVFCFGAFGVLSFSPYNLWIASIISMVGLIKYILTIHWKQIVFYSTFWGIGFFGIGLSWIYISIAKLSNICTFMNILLMVCLIIYLSLFPTLFSIILAITIRLSMITQKHIILLTPIFWSITEYLREHIFTGFPWLQFGYTQIDGPLKGIAPIFGVQGITFILLLISTLISLAIQKKNFYLVLIALGLMFSLYPLTWINWYQLQPLRAVSVALIQGNIKPIVQWDPFFRKLILQKYLQYTLPIIKTKIIVWPETAIPGVETNNEQFLTMLDNQFRKYHTNLIAGIIHTENNQGFFNHYNSIIVIGDPIPYKYPHLNRYNKHHLVLFAENIPLQKIIKPLLKFFDIPFFHMKKGHYLQPQLMASNIKITAAVCYEIIFGNQIRDNFKADTDFLLTIANDAWFNHSIGPWQHFQMARMRALELGRPLLRSTNNGITAIINANGSIYMQLPQFVSSVLHADIIPTTGLTPYAKFGPFLFWYCITLIFLIYLL